MLFRSNDDTTGPIKHSIYHYIPNIPSGFYESYSLGKNSLGNSFPDRQRKADSYGGNSILGTKDAIIAKYHWTYDYLMWGVSWAVVNLMMADAQHTDYESGKEQRSGKTEIGDSDVLDLSDPKNIEILKRMAQ